MMESSILDIHSLDEIEGGINRYESVIHKMIDGVTLSINEFKNNDVVTSLVESGRIGSDVENNLTVIKDNLNKLREVSEALKKETRDFVNEQKSMINRGLYL